MTEKNKDKKDSGIKGSQPKPAITPESESVLSQRADAIKAQEQRAAEQKRITQERVEKERDIKAFNALHAILQPLSSEQRQRAIRAAMIILGEDE